MIFAPPRSGITVPLPSWVSWSTYPMKNPVRAADPLMVTTSRSKHRCRPALTPRNVPAVISGLDDGVVRQPPVVVDAQVAAGAAGADACAAAAGTAAGAARVTSSDSVAAPIARAGRRDLRAW